MRVLSVVLSALLVLALPASAKEGVRAKVEGTVRLATAPGRQMRIVWRLVDADGREFAASGIHLRVSRCGGGLRRVNARTLGGGRYSARVIVPPGGIRRLAVGLEGRRTVGATTRRADVVFAFAPPLVRRCG
jgi:hypothetical protein